MPVTSSIPNAEHLHPDALDYLANATCVEYAKCEKSALTLYEFVRNEDGLRCRQEYDCKRFGVYYLCITYWDEDRNRFRLIPSLSQNGDG